MTEVLANTVVLVIILLYVSVSNQHVSQLELTQGSIQWYLKSGTGRENTCNKEFWLSTLWSVLSMSAYAAQSIYTDRAIKEQM